MHFVRGLMMDRFYKFAIVRFTPDQTRGETLNLGTLVVLNEGLDIRLTRRLERVRAFSAALDTSILYELVDNLKVMDERLRDKELGTEERIAMLSQVGPLKLSEFGTFRAENVNAYEARLAQIFKSMIDPEPALPRMREKRSKLLTQVKSFFRQERVLAKRNEGLDSHRIVAGLELDEGLTADLVLKNGAMHIVETVDASGDESSLRKAIGEIGTAALVLERARMKFGEQQTKSRIVYAASSSLERVAMPSLEAAQHQGAEIINWASADDRNKFIRSLASLATPIERKSAKKQAKPSNSKFL
jgi:hypothetical protein